MADIIEHRYAYKGSDKGIEKSPEKTKIKVTFNEYMQVIRAIADSAYSKLDTRRQVKINY